MVTLLVAVSGYEINITGHDSILLYSSWAISSKGYAMVLNEICPCCDEIFPTLLRAVQPNDLTDES